MRRRLIVAIAGVASLAVVLFAVPLGLVLERVYRDESVLRLQRDTVAATRAIDVTAGSRDPVELPGDPRMLTVYDAAGRRLAGRGGPPRADAVVREALARQRLADRVRGDRVIVAVPLVIDERVTGAVRAEGVHRGGARGTWLALIGVAAAVIALAMVAAAVLGRRLSGPLERLSAAASRLGDGDFASRAPRAGVAELDAVATALDATAVRLDDLVSRERAFSADASHQLRTPLAALRLELESLELQGEPAPELQAAIGQVDRLQETITTLLSVARDTPHTSTSCDLQVLLADVRSRWRGLLAADNRPLRVDDATGTIAPIAPAVLREILDVLLDNAHRHGAGPVRVTRRDVAGALAIDVGDQGPGITGDAESVFARRSGSTSGHGIGLALARSLAHAEGAQLVLTRAAPHPVFTVLLRAGDRAGEETEPRTSAGQIA